ncbi:MAG TPA: hypothetical protein VHO23_01470 [Candidatus Paceibacterota bacterium]|nr:hypothetical protein [Candidatus Paceibacterota bacterium]
MIKKDARMTALRKTLAAFNAAVLMITMVAVSSPVAIAQETPTDTAPAQVEGPVTSDTTTDTDTDKKDATEPAQPPADDTQPPATDPGTGTTGDDATNPESGDPAAPSDPAVDTVIKDGGNAVMTFVAPLMDALLLAPAAALDPFPSTNAQNQVNGYPYVEFVSATTDSVTLNFVNPKPQTYYFEYRIDGLVPSGRPSNYNPCKESATPLNGACGGARYIADDEIAYPTHSVAGNLTNQVTIPAGSTVEIRMTFGPERNYDFDWITFDVATPPDTSNIKFVGSPKYVRANNGGDLAAQLVTPDSTTAVNFFIDGSATPVAGTLHGSATASTDWWRLYTPLAPGEHAITAQVEIGGAWYDASDTGTAYSLDTPWAQYIVPNAGQMFRPDDMVVRLKIDDQFDQFKEVRVTLNSIVHTVLRSSCNDIGASVLCDLKDLGLPAGTYSASATIYTKANNRLDNLMSETFTIDDQRPVATGILVENAALGVVTNTVVVSANATDDHGVESVNFYVTEPRNDGVCTGNGTKLASERVLATDIDGKYRATLGVAGLAGPYCVTAVARDDAMNNSQLIHQKVSIENAVVDNDAPSVPVIIVPSNGQVFTSAPILNDWTDSTDASGIDKYEVEYVYSDGHTFSGGPYRETAGNVSQRSHAPGVSEQGGVTIRVRAYDNAGNVSGWSEPVFYVYDQDGTYVSRIISPADSETVSGASSLTAFYADENGDNNDGVQWAVRSGASCTNTSGTVFGNVDGRHDAATWDHENFEASIDTTAIANGEYCFVFNPTEDAGDANQRLTRVFSVLNDDSVPTVPGTETITVTGTTASGENDIGGWFFNRDASTQSPYAFATGNASIGSGSLYVEPIENDINGDSDKFIGELFLQKALSEINGISFDFKIGAPDDTVAEQFYMNVYATFGASSDTKYYDCRYDIVASSGSTAGYSTVSFDPNATYALVTQSGSSPSACPQKPSDMGAGAKVRAIALTVGDQSDNDAGVSGYLDNVIVDTDSMVTTYDFEAVSVPATVSRGNGGGGGSARAAAASADDGDDEDGRVLGASTDAACSPLITTFMGFGRPNDAGEVGLLQDFLNAQAGAGLPVTGFFGAMTQSAVHAYQKAHWQEILQPWFSVPGSGIADADDSTGFVGKMTQWKVNMTHCPELDLPTPELP